MLAGAVVERKNSDGRCVVIVGESSSTNLEIQLSCGSSRSQSRDPALALSPVPAPAASILQVVAIAPTITVGD